MTNRPRCPHCGRFIWKELTPGQTARDEHDCPKFPYDVTFETVGTLVTRQPWVSYTITLEPDND